MGFFNRKKPEVTADKVHDLLMDPEETGNVAVLIPELVKAGTDLNEQNSGGDTLLGKACTVGNAAAVKALLDAGANPNGRMFPGEGQINCVPIMEAAANANLEIIKLLLDAGADLFLKDSDGEMVLDYLNGRIESRNRHGLSTDKEDEVAQFLKKLI